MIQIGDEDGSGLRRLPVAIWYEGEVEGAIGWTVTINGDCPDLYHAGCRHPT